MARWDEKRTAMLLRDKQPHLAAQQNWVLKWTILYFTVNLVGPVFHLFSLGNPDFIIYMAELRVDEFGMNFQLWCSKHLRYEFYIQYISTFYAKLVWWNTIPWVAEIYGMIFRFDNNRNFKQFGLGQQCEFLMRLQWISASNFGLNLGSVACSRCLEKWLKNFI